MSSSPGSRQTAPLEDSIPDSYRDQSQESDDDSSQWSDIEETPPSLSESPPMNDAMLKDMFKQILPRGVQLPADISSAVLRGLAIRLFQEAPRRQRLKDVHNMQDVIRLLKTSSNIMVLTGAGISVSCGIPDFRSTNGIYAQLAEIYPELSDPQSLFDIHYFHIDPQPFFSFAKELYPGRFKPSPSHYFIAALEKHRKLLRNYSQNIDTLEQSAGISKLVQCHGSFSTASCTRCGHKVSGEVIKDEIMQGTVPWCTKCKTEDQNDSDTEDELALMKPDIVFFGENLPHQFHSQLQEDIEKADLLIVMGSSLKVKPVALVPSLLDPNVPQILINKESLKMFNFDVELIGNSDDIIEHLCHELGEDWVEQVPFSHPCKAKESAYEPPNRIVFGSTDLKHKDLEHSKIVIKSPTGASIHLPSDDLSDDSSHSRKERKRSVNCDDSCVDVEQKCPKPSF